MHGLVVYIACHLKLRQLAASSGGPVDRIDIYGKCIGLILLSDLSFFLFFSINFSQNYMSKKKICQGRPHSKFE